MVTENVTQIQEHPVFSLRIFPGIFKMGGTFTFDAAAGGHHTETKPRTYTSTITVIVPAKSKQKISLIANMKTATVDFSTPITVNGMVGANFGDK